MPTNPGFHPNTSFDEYPKNCFTAIREIGKNFYVTRSFNSESVGNSDYYALLARPAEEFSVHLNADREILFLFANYKTFEIRTLEAYDLFYSQLEQKRVDKSIRFLISDDPRIEQIVQHYLNQHPEYPIIIPIHLENILEGGHSIIESIRRNYILRDLFGYQNPLREETFFFGRQEQVNAVLDLAKSGQSSSIFGLRKSGKTSSIYAIMRRAKSVDCTPVFIDCQSPIVHSRRYNELLSYLISETRLAIGHKKALSPIVGSDAEVADMFRSQLKTALGQAKTKILYIFDEIENISPKTASSRHWTHNRDSLLFWQNIRSFIQQDSSGRLAICLVGTNPLLLEEPKIQDIANPMYLFCQKRFLNAFSFDDTREMIDRLGFFMGLEITPGQIAELQKMYGGHPFFIRQVCSNIHQLSGQNRPVRVSDRLLQSATEKFGGQLDSYLSNILEDLNTFYPSEYKLLRAVVEGEKAEITEFGREAPELIDHLIGYGLVEKNGEDFDLRFDAVKHALERILLPSGEQSFWTECMLRRNKIEQDIRRELFTFTKQIDSNTWINLLRSQMSNTRFESLKSIEPRIVLSVNESPLYFTDLMSIIKSDIVMPYLEARRLEIVSAMHTINAKGRKDAHAKRLSDIDMEEVREAFSVLETEFAQPD